jgi:hypothetical protein
MMCKYISKSCAIEIGDVVAKIAGPQVIRQRMQDMIGRPANIDSKRLELPQMIGQYHTKVCPKSVGRRDEL